MLSGYATLNAVLAVLYRLMLHMELDSMARTACPHWYPRGIASEPVEPQAATGQGMFWVQYWTVQTSRLQNCHIVTGSVQHASGPTHYVFSYAIR